MRTNVIETVMGAVVLMIAGFFLAFAYTNSGYRSSNDGVDYHATFDRVDGLVVGGDVRMSGVKIGVIREMSINPETFLAHVSFSIAPHIKIPKDSSAEIVSDGIMGGKYLALVPGGDEETLKAGDQIEHTQSSVSLEAMIGQLIFSAKNKETENEKGKPHP
ncbi:MAG: outer membrane lipid asymmetry maintenance protein MlaD [Caedimonas sp.]|jgi:phospholipid/cholesterol/gamma-HCH transport system substrate-binding protein|nr:outer membrane lipid asymmetry maintenance protein MlaD [Caedimonas sp.]